MKEEERQSQKQCWNAVSESSEVANGHHTQILTGLSRTLPCPHILPRKLLVLLFTDALTDCNEITA